MNGRRLIAFLVLGLVTVLICGERALAGGLDTNDPSLPPIPSTYASPSDVHATYHGPGLVIVLSQIEHKPFSLISRTPSGPNEIENFNSNFDGNISLNGSPNQPVSGSGPVTTEVFGKVGITTGTFNTEMLAMSLTGTSPFGPFMIRESPTLATTGQTTVASTPAGPGLYHIDSFFDVFTELSIDGGSTWIPSDSSTRVDLMPEPTGLTLIGLGLFGLTGIARRRRSRSRAKY